MHTCTVFASPIFFLACHNSFPRKHLLAVLRISNPATWNNPSKCCKSSSQEIVKSGKVPVILLDKATPGPRSTPKSIFLFKWIKGWHAKQIEYSISGVKKKKVKLLFFAHSCHPKKRGNKSYRQKKSLTVQAKVTKLQPFIIGIYTE